MPLHSLGEGSGPGTAILTCLAAAVAGRRFVLVGHAWEEQRATVDALRQLGAAGVFVLISGSPVATPPPGVMVQCLGPDDAATPAGISQLRQAIDAPSAALVRRLDEWDPERRALVLDTPLGRGSTVLGRRRYGWTRDAWAVFEQKTAVDCLWPRAGLRAAESAVVPLERRPLLAAVRHLDTGRGTVWAGESTGVTNTSALNLRWVRDAAGLDAAVKFFTPNSGRVRIMPFLDGMPCSIHGLVLPDGIAVFRPLELVVLHDERSGRFEFAGTSTLWDCPPPVHKELASVVRRVGRRLIAEAGYRGAFTLDGIMTDEGFRPTEVNARLGSGLAPAVTMPAIPLYLLNAVAIEEELANPCVPPQTVEAVVLEALDRRRVARILVTAPGEIFTRISLGCREGRYAPVPAHDADVVIIATPRSGGTTLEIVPSPARQSGNVVGPLVAAALDYWNRTVTPLGRKLASAVP